MLTASASSNTSWTHGDIKYSFTVNTVLQASAIPRRDAAVAARRPDPVRLEDGICPGEASVSG